MKVHGVSLHFFDDTKNSDKYYRAFVWQDSGTWNVTYHWGRDGAPRGQLQTSCYYSLVDADREVAAKVNAKIRKGYQYLGQGEIEVDSLALKTEVGLASVGHVLHMKVGRKPIKLPHGFSMVIMEEDDIEDLI